MRIIDTHVHLGMSKFSGVDTTEEGILHSMESNQVEACLVMPQPTLDDVSKVHERIFRFTKQYPGKIFGMASIDPWLSDEEFDRHVSLYLGQYRFKAIKLHPMGHNISPLSPLCDKVYEAARRYRVPVLIHTGLGIPFSFPSLAVEPARRFSDVRFVLCHAGFAVYTDEAIVAAKLCENIVLEPSWCPTYAVSKMIDNVGIDRMIMGSDHLNNLPVELAKWKALNLSENQLEQVFFYNPNDLFQLHL